MEKEFVPYEQALALKELGFDEPCWCYFIDDIFNPSMFLKDYEYLNTMNQKYNTYTLAPLYQQTFRWFREKYKIFSCIMTEYSYGGHISTYHINGERQSNISKGNYKTYEEAELECLKKLIEIVKNK